MKKIVALLIFIGYIAYAETPKEGLIAITNFYKSKNMESLVKERYTEIHKAESIEDVQKIIDYLNKDISKEEKLKKYIEFFEALQKVEPEIYTKDSKYVQETETGEVAKFKLESGRTYRLYEMKDGRWGFHL